MCMYICSKLNQSYLYVCKCVCIYVVIYPWTRISLKSKLHVGNYFILSLRVSAAGLTNLLNYRERQAEPRQAKVNCTQSHVKLM